MGNEKRSGVYVTPFGMFRTWNEAAEQCERMDVEPLDVVAFIPARSREASGRMPRSD